MPAWSTGSVTVFERFQAEDGIVFKLRGPFLNDDRTAYDAFALIIESQSGEFIERLTGPEDEMRAIFNRNKTT